MPERATGVDRDGLPITTRCARAVEHYTSGIDRLLALEAGAEAALHPARDASWLGQAQKDR